MQPLERSKERLSAVSHLTACITCPPPAPSPIMPNLFLTPERHSEWREQIQNNDPTAMAMLAHMRDLSENPDPAELLGPDALRDEQESAMACLTLAWVEQDSALAARGHQRLTAVLEKPPHSDLGKAAQSLLAVLAWEFGNALWNPEKKKQFADLIHQKALSFLKVTEGNPHIVTNNWWMLTHGGCLLACLAIDGESGTNGPIDLNDLKSWALARFKAFCGSFGTAGLYHEGSGYTSYTLSMLMPTLLAVSRTIDPDILHQFPQLRHSIPSMLVATSAIRHLDIGSDKETFGASLQWNDAGRGCLGINPFLPGLAVAPAEWRGALRSVFDRLIGYQGRNVWTCPYRGFAMAVLLYPFSTTPEDPEKILPKQVFDQRHGLGFWRSHWGMGEESVIGWYARSVAPGGHRQDDAASVRLIARGRTWICGGGQARGKAQWQSIFTQAKEEDRPRPAPLAHVSALHVRPNGGVVGMDTRKCLGAYGERYLAWHQSNPDLFMVALLDLLEDFRDPALDWQWNLSFPRELEPSVHDDNLGFTVHDPQNGFLTGRFLLDAPDQIEFRQMPPSRRTFSGGKSVDYPGDLFLSARFLNRGKARILVALAVSPEPLMTTLSGKILNTLTYSWEQPFHPAILASVNLAEVPPNLMTRPAG